MKVIITGAAGFIGSHLTAACLKRGDEVIGIDNLLTGKMENIESVLSEVPESASRLHFHKEDVRDLGRMRELFLGGELVFHEAALGSVPWSIKDPLLTHATNMTGFVNVLEASRANGIERVVYASSSAVFGDSTASPAFEGAEGEVLSPYAATKRAQEIYSQAWSRCYGMTIVGLRYFNVFGARQDPNGAYAAVIPKWLSRMKSGRACAIFGDGSSTRDYCHVSNVIRANFLAASHAYGEPASRAYNIGCGLSTSLIELHEMMRRRVEEKFGLCVASPEFMPPRAGDIAHSLASIDAARRELGFEPVCSVEEGLELYI